MLSNNQFKHLRSLRLKKNRYAHRQFLVEGETVVAELLDSHQSDIQALVCTARYQSSLAPTRLRDLGERLHVCDESMLRKISSLDTPSAVLVLLSMPSEAAELKPLRGLGLYLDGIRDPGNLGTIIRVADWFGLHSISLAADCVDIYNPKTIQASMGSFLRVPVRVATLASIQAAQPDLHLLGTSIDQGVNALNFEWPASAMLVIGSESRGVRSENISSISQWLSIPRGAASSGAESLNAAVATGILAAAYARSFP
jgi:RNA methyltransferase, TrmH family